MANWSKGLSGNAGVFYAALRATKAGFAVSITTRNMEGPDMVLVDQQGNTFPVQVKAWGGSAEDVSGFGKGVSPAPVREAFWVFVAGSLTDNPRCYVLTRDQVTANLGQDPGTRSMKAAEERLWWFCGRRLCKAGHPSELVDALDAWHRIA